MMDLDFGSSQSPTVSCLDIEIVEEVRKQNSHRELQLACIDWIHANN